MKNSKSQTIAIIGYAFDKGGITSGSKEGPDVIRRRGLVERLEKLGLSTKDLGNSDASLESPQKPSKKELDAGVLDIAEVYSATSNIKNKVREALDNDLFPLTIGGDHSVSIGSTQAVSDFYKERGEKIGLIWIDTHSDINIPETSPSKRAFGMSVAYLTGLIDNNLVQDSLIGFENTTFLGLRDVDQGERKIIKENNIFSQTVKDIDIIGMAAATKKAIEVASKDTAGFVVSFDLDVCDPRIVPGIQTPIRGGLTFREAHLVLELLYDSKKMLALELVELNPLLDRNFETADLAVSLIESGLGSSLL